MRSGYEVIGLNPLPLCRSWERKAVKDLSELLYLIGQSGLSKDRLIAELEELAAVLAMDADDEVEQEGWRSINE